VIGISGTEIERRREMNIGIIVHSETGNTHSVATTLKEKLAAAGHTVSIERLKVVGESKICHWKRCPMPDNTMRSYLALQCRVSPYRR
jgi:hypothetical protein